MTISKTVIASFTSHDQAEEAVGELSRAGFDMKKLSIVGKGYHSEEQPLGFYNMGDRMKSWGGFGAFWGTLWGVLLGSAFFWVPGLGLIGAGGPFIHMIIAAFEGAALGGGISVIGAALAGWGVPKNSVIKYETRIKSNEFLLIARGEETEIEKARQILSASTASETEVFSQESES